jgi:hypothetical protein
MKPYCGDWKNAKDYPPIRCFDSNWLAWEFIRRNSAYAKEVALMAPLIKSEEFSKGFKRDSKSLLDGVVCYPEAKPNETVQEFYKRTSLEKIKRRRIVKPEITFQRRWQLKKPISPDTEYASGLVEFDLSNVRLVRNDEFKTKNFALILHPNEAAVRFSLDLPLANQIKEATQKLRVEILEYAKIQKSLSIEEQKIFGSNANKNLKKDVFENAHYWLRCYDASIKQKLKPVEPKAMTAKSKGKRELENGPNHRLRVFKEEIEQFKAANMEMLNKERGKFLDEKRLEDGTLKGYLRAVKLFINKKKFQKLMHDDVKAYQIKSLSPYWPSPINSDNETSK